VTDVTASAFADALRDRYTIERELGRGGMATVYLAHEKALKSYGFVADIWRRADPELQPSVAEARAGLQRLTKEPRP